RPGPRPFFMNIESGVRGSGPTTRTVTVPRVPPTPFLPNRYEDNRYLLSRGDHLVIDTGAQQRHVTIPPLPLPPPVPLTRQVTLTYVPFPGLVIPAHNELVPLSNVWFHGSDPGRPTGNLTMLGHPGPQEHFDPHNPDYGGVVRYMSVIVK